MALLICPECGGKVSDKAEVCPTCGCPGSYIIVKAKEFKQKEIQSRIHKMIIIGSAVVTIIAFIIVIYAIIKPNPSGYYNGIKWGTSFDVLKQQIGDNATDINEEGNSIRETVYDFNEIKNVVGYVTYYFKDKKLYAIAIEVGNSEYDTGLTCIEVYKILCDNLTEMYGKGKEKNLGIKIWETKNSQISIYSNGIKIRLTYSDINDKINDKEEKDL